MFPSTLDVKEEERRMSEKAVIQGEQDASRDADALF